MIYHNEPSKEELEEIRLEYLNQHNMIVNVWYNAAKGWVQIDPDHIKTEELRKNKE